MRVLSLASLLLLASCSAERRDPAPARPPPSRPEPALEPSAPPEPPLADPREVRVEAEDGVALVGDLRASADPAAPLVILVHQLGSTRAEWEPLLRRLGPSFTTYAFDLRGHGQSTARGEGEVSYASFTGEDWARLASDVRAVLGHLLEEEGLQPRRVALVGSSIGSSAAILAAASDPSVTAIVALSPGRAYRGLDAITPLAQLGDRPLLAIASRGEAPSAEAAADIARVARGGALLLVDGDRHGVAMFESAPESLDRVERFLRAELQPR